MVAKKNGKNAVTISFVPVGSIAATDVQSALQEVDSEKIAKTTNLTALNDTGIADGEIAVFNLTNKDIRTSDKTIVTTLGTTDLTVPTSKAVKDVTDTRATVADLTGTAETLGGSSAVGVATTAARSDHKHAITNPAIDTLAAATDITTCDVSTSAHGLAPKAVAPALGLRNVFGVDNAETAISNKALFDTSNPAMNGTASPGTQMTVARRDHIHPSDTSRLANSGATNGNIYIGKADGTFALVNITPGANVTITNADGTITIASSGGGDFLVGQIFS